MSITRINEFQAVQGKEEQLHQFLLSLIPYITSSQGCESCEVLRHQEQLDTFVIIEKWQSVDSHKASIANYPKEDMEAAMHLFGGAPKGGYYQ